MLSYFDRIDRCLYGYRNISLKEIIQIIRTGELMLKDAANVPYTLRQITEAIRQHPDKMVQNAMKSAYCPAITVNGTWDGQRISQYSQLLLSAKLKKGESNFQHGRSWAYFLFRPSPPSQIQAIEEVIQKPRQA